MWKMGLPELGEAEAELLRALTRANGESVFETSAAQRAALLQLYQQYDVTQGKPANGLLGVELGQPFLDAIYSAYDQVQVGRRLSELRDRLKAAAHECPYCGFGEIYDLDHHLARSVYRALAIYCRNLIPCCHPCNNKKRAVGGADPAEQFSHPYFDDYPTERFLVANVAVSEQAGLCVEFEVVQCQGMTDNMLARLKFQFSRLDLNRRYEAQVVTFIASRREGIEGAAESGSDSLRNWLQKAHDSHAKGFGLNDWRTALLDGLVRSDQFCQGAYKYAFGEKHTGA
jgi:hypothetical protein